MEVKSKIYLNEKVINTSKHRLADEEYYIAYAIEENGSQSALLFTDNDIIKAKNRALKNTEDLLPMKKSIWQKIFWFITPH